MKALPIYDDTAPIACSADRAEIAGRIEQIERLRADLDGVERTEHGLLLRFPNRADVDAELRTFVVDEKGCCAFWGFEISATADQLRLRWDAPPTLADLMDRLLAQFESDEPFTALSGLL